MYLPYLYHEVKYTWLFNNRTYKLPWKYTKKHFSLKIERDRVDIWNVHLIYGKTLPHLMGKC
jgi:hypothetical protein